MKILVLNQDWFAHEFREAGHEVITCGLKVASHLEYKVEMPMFHIQSIIHNLPNHFIPDRIVVLDNSSPILFSGFDEIDIPTLFYSVDTHHHADLHRYLYYVFDHTLIAQKDYVGPFHEFGLAPEWMPLWASRYVEASDQKERGAVFVGNLNPKLNPDRVTFFESLAKKVPIEFKMGEYWTIFPFSEIVINQTVKGDLNFRVFEAMMCGAMLLTERSGNGLLELFEEGKHLVCYEKNNVDEAAEKIKYYTEHPEEARKIAAAGRAEILAKHTPKHRAARLLDILEGLKKQSGKLKFFAMMMNHGALCRAYREVDPMTSMTCLAGAMKSAEYGIDFKEPITSEVACHLIILSLEYERRMKTGAGYTIIFRAADAYSEEPSLQLARIRCCLNTGRIDEAKEYASRFKGESPNEIFENAEALITSLMAEG